MMCCNHGFSTFSSCSFKYYDRFRLCYRHHKFTLQVWQTDVTHILEFGHLQYVHVSIDTFSSAIWASVHNGERSCDAITHWQLAFAALGIPHTIKTDNGPAYIS